MPASVTTESLRPTRLQIGLWVLLVALMLLLALRNWDAYAVGAFFDDAIYVALGESFTASNVYGLYFLPPAQAATQLPFGFPLMLAPLAAAFPGQFDLLRLVPLLASVANLSILFWGWRQIAPRFSYGWAITVCALLALSPLTILFARIVLSEAVFLTWCLLTLWLVEHLAERPRWGTAMLLGIVALGMVYTRTIGWVLFATLLFYLAFKLRTKIVPLFAVTAATVSVVLGGLLAFTPIQPRDLIPQEYLIGYSYSIANRSITTGNQREKSYPEHILDLIRVHLDITDLLPKQVELELRRISIESGLDDLRLVPGITLLALMTFGAWRWFRRSGVTAFLIILPLYLFSLVFWPWVGSRLLYPVQPQFILMFLLGGEGIARSLVNRLPLADRSRAPRFGLGAALALLLAAAVTFDLRVNAWFLPLESRAVTAEWILKNTPADSIWLSPQPATDFIYTRRKMVDQPRAQRTTQELVDRIQQYGVQYLVGRATDSPVANAGIFPPYWDRAFDQAINDMVAQGALTPLYKRAEANVIIYQVNHGRLAIQP